MGTRTQQLQSSRQVSRRIALRRKYTLTRLLGNPQSVPAQDEPEVVGGGRLIASSEVVADLLQPHARSRGVITNYENWG